METKWRELSRDQCKGWEGVEVTYKDDGTEAKRYTYKDGKPVKD